MSWIHFLGSVLAKNSRQSDAGQTITQNDYDDDASLSAPTGRPSIKSTRVASNPTGQDQFTSSRPSASRAITFEGPRQLHRDDSPMAQHRVTRVPSDNVTIKSQRDRLQALSAREPENNDRFSDPSDESALYSSPERPFRQRSASPATSYGSGLSRQGSYSNLDTASVGKKAPPPPPPPRSKKPPPPPPMKRSALTTNVSYA